MTLDEIIRMAREVGIDLAIAEVNSGYFERFAELVKQHLIAQGYRKCAENQRTTQYCGQLEAAVAAEREACAKIVEESSLPDAYSKPVLLDIADDIRARGEK